MEGRQATWLLGGGVGLLLVVPLAAGAKPYRFGLLAVAMLVADARALLAGDGAQAMGR